MITRNEDRVGYLILQLAVPSSCHPPSSIRELKTLDIAVATGNLMGVHVWPVRVNHGKNADGEFRYAFNFPGYTRNDQIASTIAEAVLLSVSIVHQPWMDTEISEVVFRFPIDIVKDNEVNLEDLIAVDEDRSFEDRIIDVPLFALGQVRCLPEHPVIVGIKISPVIQKHEKFQRAVQFLCESQNNFFLWSDLGKDPEGINQYIPTNGFEQIKYENALQNAFKAVEAIIGDPPKSDEKLRKKLEGVGLNHLETFAFSNQSPLLQIIREMNAARDMKAAHGSLGRKNITAGELWKYQACARYILISAIKHEIGEEFYL